MGNLLILLLRIPYMWQVTSLLLLSRSSHYFVFRKSDYNVSCMSLWVHLTWSSLTFLDPYIHLFQQIWEVLSYCSNISSVPPPVSSSSRTPTMCIIVPFDGVLKVPCSVAKLFLTLCLPMDCSTPDSSVLHYFQGFSQLHVPLNHWN